MAKKNSSTNIKSVSRPPTSAKNQLTVVFIGILFLALAFVTLKYLLARESWIQYGNQAQEQILNYPTTDSINDASTIAATVIEFPESNALWNQPKLLQNYVDVVSKKTGRDIVIIDVNGVILADTISENIGEKWAEDKEGEVMLTIMDSKPRSFQEISEDYPSGLMQVVVPVKDEAGKTFGAVVLSSDSTLR